MKFDGFNLAAVLAAHKVWLLDHQKGSFADLSFADLSFADLSFADLSFADLRSANLHSANLSFANLSSANLGSANLRSANLSFADLRFADLGSANLGSANLGSANLRFANLGSADLRFANLRSTNLDALQQSRLSLVGEGDLIVWKQCQDGVLVKLRIPREARRSNSTGRKCRAEFADVLEILGGEVGKSKNLSGDGIEIEYRAGQRVTADSWDENRWNECSHGIHFYLHRVEAEND